MLAHTWKLGNDGNSGGIEHILGANTTVEKNCRAPDASTSQYNLLVHFYGQLGRAAIASVFNGIGGEVVLRRGGVEQDAGDVGVCEDIIIGTRWQRVKISRPTVRPGPV